MQANTTISLVKSKIWEKHMKLQLSRTYYVVGYLMSGVISYALDGQVALPHDKNEEGVMYPQPMVLVWDTMGFPPPSRRSLPVLFLFGAWSDGTIVYNDGVKGVFGILDGKSYQDLWQDGKDICGVLTSTELQILQKAIVDSNFFDYAPVIPWGTKYGHIPVDGRMVCIFAQIGGTQKIWCCDDYIGQKDAKNAEPFLAMWGQVTNALYQAKLQVNTNGVSQSQELPPALLNPGIAPYSGMLPKYLALSPEAQASNAVHEAKAKSYADRIKAERDKQKE